MVTTNKNEATERDHLLSEHVEIYGADEYDDDDRKDGYSEAMKFSQSS